MIKSKFKFGETKISVRKVIYKTGRNIDKNGTAEVYVEIISFFVNGTRKTRRIPTGVRVIPKHFDTKKNDGYITTKDPASDSKNTIINKLFGEYVNLLTKREAGTWDENYNPENLIPINDLIPKKTKYLTNYIDDYIEYRKNINTPRGTLKEFTSLKNRLIRYEQDKNIKLKFDDLFISFSDTFYSFLLNEKFSSGTIHKTFVLLGIVLNYYFERQEELHIKLSDKFKYKNFKKGTPSRNDPKPLSEIEFTTLVNHHFDSDTLNKHKERFLFQCATGMRYSDMFTITKENIEDGCIIYYPEKTRRKLDNKVILPLNNMSRFILEGYNFDMTKLRISNQKYNDGLRDMFVELNMKYPDIFKTIYTSHNGRDTFISNCLMSGIDIPSLLKMVGQSNYAIMSRYVKISTEHIRNRMAQVNQYNTL